MLSVLNEFAGVMGKVLGGERRYEGPMGKSDLAFLFGLIATVYALLGQLPEWSVWVLYVAVFLLAITCVNRVKAGLGE